MSSGKRIKDLPARATFSGADLFEISQLIAGIQTSAKVTLSDLDFYFGVGNDLATVLANGNTTGGTDVIFSTGDKLKSATGNFTMEFGGFGNVMYLSDNTNTDLLFGQNQFIFNHDNTLTDTFSIDTSGSVLKHDVSVYLQSTVNSATVQAGYGIVLDSNSTAKLTLSETTGKATLFSNVEIILNSPLYTFSTLTATTVPYLDASKRLRSSTITPTELGYLAGVPGLITSTYLPFSGGTMTGSLVLYADATAANQAVTYSQFNNALTGLKWKANVRSASTINKTLSGVQSVDSVVVGTGDRVLMKDQTDPKENGIWDVNTSGAWTRSTDADLGSEIRSSTVYVEAGTTNGGTQWTNSNAAAITIGVTNITFAKIAGAGVYTNGTYLKLTGNVFDIDFTTFSTNQITEGGSNKYFTTGRVDTQVATYTGDVTLSGTTFSIGASKVTNAMLVNSSVTFNGQTVALGSSGTITANVTNALSVDNSSLQLDSGTTFDGSAARIISVKALGITNTMLAGSIAYSKLVLTNSVVSGDIVSLAWSKITATPTTISGYGITDTTAQLLGGLSITGSSITSSDSILTAFGKVQNQINGLLGGAIYKGVYNATTNTPTLADGSGTAGYYYVVNVAGNQNFGSGVINFNIGDWAIYNGTIWQKVDNTDAVSDVNGAIGSISLIGTANRITVTGTTWDISAAYVGQSSITTLGTVTTGVWNATTIADAYLATSYIKADGSRALTADWNAGAFNITSKTQSVSGTGGNGYMELLAQSSNVTSSASSSFRLFAGATGSFNWVRKNGSDTYVRTFDATLTADRTYTLQNVASTIAMYSNKLSVFATTTSAELAGVVTDASGSGVFARVGSPTFTTNITLPQITGNGSSNTGLTLVNTVTASSAVAYGTYTAPALSAAANADQLYGMYIVPTFTLGAFTSTNSFALGIQCGTATIKIGNQTGSTSTPAIYIGIATPSSTNYALASLISGADTHINGSASVRFDIGGSIMATLTSKTLTLGGGQTNFDVSCTSTNGTKWGKATTDKMGWWNVTPVIQPASASQAAVATTAATNVTPYGYTQAQADGIITLLNQIRSDLVSIGLLKGSA